MNSATSARQCSRYIPHVADTVVWGVSYRRAKCAVVEVCAEHKLTCLILCRMWALCQLYIYMIYDVVTQACIIIATVKYRYYRYSPTDTWSQTIFVIFVVQLFQYLHHNSISCWISWTMNVINAAIDFFNASSSSAQLLLTWLG